jgi:hypothetical protein
MDERAALLGGRNAGHVSGDRPVRVSIAPEVVPDKAHFDLGGDGGQGHQQRTSPWVRALLLVGLVALVVTCAALTRAEISSRHVATPRLVSPGFDQLTADGSTAALEKKHIPTEEVAHAGKRSKHKPDDVDDYHHVDGEWVYDYEQWDGDHRQ